MRKDKQKSFPGGKSLSFQVGKCRLVPGFLSKNGTGYPDLVLYEE